MLLVVFALLCIYDGNLVAFWKDEILFVLTLAVIIIERNAMLGEFSRQIVFDQSSLVDKDVASQYFALNII